MTTIFFLVFVPFTAAFCFLRARGRGTTSPIMSLSTCRPEDVANDPSVVPRGGLLRSEAGSGATSLAELPVRADVRASATGGVRARYVPPMRSAVQGARSMRGHPSKRGRFTLPCGHSKCALTLTVSTNGGKTDANFVGGAFSQKSVKDSRGSRVVC